MKFSILVAFLCGILISTLEARVVSRDRRSFFDAPKAPQFPSVVLVGLVDQPVPTVVGIPQQNSYSGPPPPSYGVPPPPPFYAPPSYAPPPYSPPSYPPPSYPPPSYSPSTYASPPSPYAPQSYMAPPPYQPPQYTPLTAPVPVPAHTPLAQQLLPASEPQHEQSVPVPTQEDLPSTVDPTITNFETSDSPSTNLTNDSRRDDKSNWETSTSSSL